MLFCGNEIKISKYNAKNLCLRSAERSKFSHDFTKAHQNFHFSFTSGDSLRNLLKLCGDWRNFEGMIEIMNFVSLRKCQLRSHPVRNHTDYFCHLPLCSAMMPAPHPTNKNNTTQNKQNKIPKGLVIDCFIRTFGNVVNRCQSFLGWPIENQKIPTYPNKSLGAKRIVC